MKMVRWLLLSLVCEVAADYCFKRWSIGGRPWLLWLGVGGYVGATVLFAACLRGESLTRLVCWFTLANCVAATLIGVCFGEPLTARVGAGVACAGLSIWLLS